MADQQVPQRRRSPLNFVFSFVVIISFIFLMIMLFTNLFSSSNKLSTYQFVESLLNQKVETVNETYYDSGIIKISGTYTHFNQETSKETRTNYYLYISPSYYSTEKNFEVDDFSNTDPVVTIAVNDISIEDLVHDADYVNQEAVFSKPYTPSWWDVWGPTLIMLGGSAILVIFLLTRMSGSISGANNKALEFNKSRARRETSSKVKFSDVAGAEEEKVEMKEIVDYLKEPKKYDAIGLVEASSDSGFTNQGSQNYAVAELKKQAAKIGANGVLLATTGTETSTNVHGYGSGMIWSSSSDAKVVKGTAIFVNEE